LGPVLVAPVFGDTAQDTLEVLNGDDGQFFAQGGWRDLGRAAGQAR
jgi:hypothetical protein